jgi:hypothetical protein
VALHLARSRKTPPGTPPPPSGHALARPGWARVHRIRLIRREFRESLSAGALDLLLAHAELVVEGSGEIDCRDPRGGNAPTHLGERVYVTLMLTIDLSRCADGFREPADAATAERVAELMRETPTLRTRLLALARPRLAELAGIGEDALEIALEPQVRADGVRVLVDGDAVAWPRARRRG